MLLAALETKVNEFKQIGFKVGDMLPIVSYCSSCSHPPVWTSAEATSPFPVCRQCHPPAKSLTCRLALQKQPSTGAPIKQAPVIDNLDLRPQRPGTMMQRPPLAPKAPPPQPAGMPVKATTPAPITTANTTSSNLKGPPAFLLKGDAYAQRQAKVPNLSRYIMFRSKTSLLACMLLR